MRRLGELLFGLEPSQWTEGGRWSLDWLAQPKGDRMLLLLAVLVLAVVGLWWLYRREAAHVSPAMRATLLGLRLCALGLAVVMLLEPIIVLSREEFVPSHVIVLADASPSMTLRDAWRDDAAAARVAEHFRVDKGAEGLRELARLDLERRLLTAEFFRSLESEGSRIVHLHTFADRLDDKQAADAGAVNLEPHGETTALGAVLQQALLSNSGIP